MAKIAIDCDGVLANFLASFYRTAIQMWPDRGLIVHYANREWNDLQGLAKSEVDQVWERIRATPHFWTALDSYTENVAALRDFLTQAWSHDIYIVTARATTMGGSVAQQTERWLYAQGLYQYRWHNYIGIIQVENPSDKRKLYKAMQVEYSLDDKDDTVVGCDSLPNHQAFLLDRPWNEKAKVKRRVSSVGEFLRLVKEVSK